VGKLGILAGAGELPRRMIEACRAADREFFVLAFRDEVDPAILTDVPHATIRLGAGRTSHSPSSFSTGGPPSPSTRA